MGRREAARAEARFMAGQTGVDGAATEEAKDTAELERDKAREGLLRGRTYLGRELLTWLLWRSEAGEPLLEVEGEGVVVLLTGRLVLKGAHGDVTELSAKGTLAPYSELVRFALQRGLLVHTARLRLTHGEKVYEATLDAEFLDVRAGKLPELMTEEEDDRTQERLYLVERLGALVDALVESFVAQRTSPAWSRQVVPALQRWMRGEDEEARPTLPERARRAAGRR